MPENKPCRNWTRLSGGSRHKSGPAGESSKSLEVATELLARLAEMGAHRRDLVGGFGGGVVTDLAGFVASTYHRGMPVEHVATTP
ncbi:MAG TPA: hypothetical protein VHL09_09070, partial [Dehalococcoidia bacterium]|nr:hypothetical protein [Dehalococcoidia bacterium]